MSYAASYLKKQQTYLKKWTDFHQENLIQNFKPLDYSTQIPTPLESSTTKTPWSDSEKKYFYYLFAQFNCEALIIFEQCFMYASRKLILELKNPDEQKALTHFAKEEFIHTKAFRHYLRRETIYQFPQKSLVIHRFHGLKNIFAWILKKEPLAIVIPGAKSETYSLFYSKLFEQHFGQEANTFTKLQALHSVDEALHVQFDYQFLDSVIQGRSFFKQLKFIFFTFLMIFFIQFIVILGFHQALKELRPKSSLKFRFCFMIHLFRWVLWSFTPYLQTRRRLKATYAQRTHWIYKIFNLGFV